MRDVARKGRRRGGAFRRPGQFAQAFCGARVGSHAAFGRHDLGTGTEYIAAQALDSVRSKVLAVRTWANPELELSQERDDLGKRRSWPPLAKKADSTWRLADRLPIPLALSVQSMPNFSSLLKSEIARLARKEVRAAVEPLRKSGGTYRREIAELKRQLASLQREIRTLAKPAREARRDAGQAKTVRFTASGLKSLRARLGLSASDFGRLVSASGQSVYNWETGKTVPRASQQVAIASVRGLGKREAAKRLEAMA